MNGDFNKSDAIDVKYQTVPNKESCDPETILNTTLFTIGYVSKELCTPTYTIRYWTDTYYEYLDIKMCNTHRRYTELDISKLKVIKHCIEKKMGHKQIVDALKSTEFSEEKLVEAIHGKQNQLNVQVMAAALISEFEERLKASNEALLKDIATYMNNQGEALQQSMFERVDKTISDRLSIVSKTLQEGFKDVTSMNTSLDNKLDTMASSMATVNSEDNDAANHMQELLSNIKQQQTNMNETILDIKKVQDELNFRSITLEEYKKECENNNKSWFSKLFGKHK